MRPDDGCARARGGDGGVTQPKFIDYKVNLVVSLGAAEAFVNVLETMMSREDTRSILSAEWIPQIERDIADIRRQLSTQSPEFMYRLRGSLFGKDTPP